MLINVTIPVLNEEKQLKASIRRVHEHVAGNEAFDVEILIVDNGSRDSTVDVAGLMTKELNNVKLICIPQRGRGRALKRAWTESQADILSYMDVDLSTDLVAFWPMIEELAAGHFEIATGSRLQTASQVTRGPKREFISRCYNLIIKLMFRTHFSDAQCGFKSVSENSEFHRN